MNQYLGPRRLSLVPTFAPLVEDVITRLASTVRPVLDEYLGSAATVVELAVFVVKPGSSMQRWHEDYSPSCDESARFVSVHVTLDDQCLEVTKSNGWFLSLVSNTRASTNREKCNGAQSFRFLLTSRVWRSAGRCRSFVRQEVQSR